MDDDKEKDDLLDQIPPEKDPNLDYSLRKVRSPQEAEAIVMALAEKGIPAQMILDGGIMDPIFIGNTPQNKYEILVQEDDKVAADKIFWELAEASIKEIPKDYHLYQYSDTELKQILVESIDWNELDVLLAEKILRDRNVELNFTEIDKSREDRKKQLAEPQSGQEAWIVIGYIFTLLGGFVGLLLGYSFWKAKKRMPDGEKTYAYSASVRTHGKIIFFIALITVTISASLLFVFSAIRAAV
ncbi:MAG: hypothetical protein DCO96_12385 [Fluviicola sp. XM-24bin1]|nr:MAG: hypothetical protein DCO96_12385 [Fluviicola sp. XM-24bin1]